jgi:hypothetical protein
MREEMNARENIPQSLDLFSINPMILAIAHCEEHELSTINTIDGTNMVEFSSPGYDSKLKSLNELYLKAIVQVTKEDGTLYSQKDALQGHITNSILTSLFKSCVLLLNNTTVVSIQDFYGIQEYIQLSLNFSPHVTASKLSNQGFYHSGEIEKLKSRVRNSVEVELMGRLNIFNVEKLILPNVNVSLKLGFQSPDFYINEETADGKTSKSMVKIKDLKLYIKHITLRESYLSYIEESLVNNAEAIYEFKSGAIVTHTIPASSTNVNLPNLWYGIRPSIVLCAFIKNSTLVGNRSEDPSIFTSHGLKMFSFLVNQENYPKTPFEITTSDQQNKYARVFNALYVSLGLSSENQNTLVDRENFLTNYFYLMQDISTYASASTSLSEPLYTVNVGLNATFEKPLESALSVLLYVLIPRKVKIGWQRNVEVVL